MQITLFKCCCWKYVRECIVRQHWKMTTVTFIFKPLSHSCFFVVEQLCFSNMYYLLSLLLKHNYSRTFQYNDFGCSVIGYAHVVNKSVNFMSFCCLLCIIVCDWCCTVCEIKCSLLLIGVLTVWWSCGTCWKRWYWCGTWKLYREEFTSATSVVILISSASSWLSG